MTQIHTASVRAGVTVSLLLILGAASPAHGDPVEAPVPRAVCGPGSNPETDRQGRVPMAEVNSGRAAQGYICNTELLGRFGPPSFQGGAGGYKVFRYIDASGHECAYYDSTLLFPANVSAGQAPGVYVLDMSNPLHLDPPPQPVRTAVLDTQAMLSPHESLAFNAKRGLLVAAYGTPETAPGQVDIYDVTADCRTPVLKSSLPVGVLGHESGMAPDGNTYYIASLDAGTLTAIDISNPSAPVPLWVTDEHRSHGLSISEDGNRAYVGGRLTSGVSGSSSFRGLVVLDVSQVQARVLNPQVPEISRLDWPVISTPQSTIPVTIAGHPYLIEFDEFNSGNNVGAVRIIDIADETHPQVISNIKLEVNMAVNQGESPGQADDYGAQTIFQGYTGHYCAVPYPNEPTVLACTFILSGLRLFDIRDPVHPTEIAYFNGPILSTNGNPAFPGTAYAMSAPAFVPERKEIWYSDGNSGFYSVRITNDAWPLPEPGVALALASGVALLAALRPLPSRARNLSASRLPVRHSAEGGIPPYED